MDLLYSSNIKDLSRAFSRLIDASPSEIEPYRKRLEELKVSEDPVMFGYTVGGLADMCLKRLEAL